MEILLTIIVPAYNAAKDLRACLESLYAQTRPVCILIANDGSTDDTAAIADQAAKHVAAVRVLHLPHEGVIATRRASIAVIETAYFAFVDADDVIEKMFAEEMLDAAVRHDADIVFCPYTCVYDGIVRHVSYGGAGEDYARNMQPIRQNPSLLLGVPIFFWGKLYRTDYIRPRIDFAPDGCVPLEDVPAIIPLLIDVPRLVKVTTPLYRYSISSKSSCRASKQELSRLTAMRVLHERLETMGALPEFFPQLHAINRCYLFDQLEKLQGYCDPGHQHHVVRKYFQHLDGTLPHWRPHPFHPTFYAAYWHWIVTHNALKNKFRCLLLGWIAL